MIHELVIEPGKAEGRYWRDLWRYRELLYFLAWRDILVRYKQTLIGIAWALVRPLITTAIFVVVFFKIAKLPSEGIPAPLFVFAAMLPWTFFATALSESSNSLIGNSNLISKIYFPRMIIPASSVVTSFVDFLISLGFMALLMAWYGFVPDWRLIFLPLFTLVAFAAAMGAGLWMAALNVKYRDFRYIIPFVVQFGLYISPVGFSRSVIPEEWRQLYYLNPMTGVIEGFRWALLQGKSGFDLHGFLISLFVILVFFVIGVRYFRATEKTFADVI